MLPSTIQFNETSRRLRHNAISVISVVLFKKLYEETNQIMGQNVCMAGAIPAHR